jgi:hypothetical protein
MSHENDTDGERINRKHTRPVADGGSKYQEPVHADADRSEVPHAYEGPTKLVRKSTPRVNGNVTEMVEVPAREEKARRRREQNQYTGVGEGGGFEDIYEGDGEVSKSTQAELEDALGDVDFLGAAETVEKGESDQIDLSWSDEDFNPPTEADLLAQIRDELAEMNAEDRERALKSLYDDAAALSAADTGQADAVATLERIEDALAAEEQAELLEEALNAYVEAAPENGLEDPLADVVAWLREQAEDMDPEERARVMDTLDRLETATGGDGAGAAA